MPILPKRFDIIYQGNPKKVKEALLYRKENGQVICTACWWYCRIPENFVGLCSIRANIKGKLNLLTYPFVSSYHLDPIEKKPFYHFLPGSFVFSLGTYGCNFGCEFCQNWEISQAPKILKAKLMRKKGQRNVIASLASFIKKNSFRLPPEEIVNYCFQYHSNSIAFTYNEPTIFAEYAFETMKIAKKYGFYGIFVSSGFETKETLDLLENYIDAYNIDLKGGTEEFYQKISHARLTPVLKTVEEILKRKKWIEITTLLIPGLNTDEKQIRFIARFIASLSKDIPWHLTAFYPHYKLLNLSPTPYEILSYGYEIGKEEGLNFVYTGNIPQKNTESTFCPSCQTLLIERFGYQVKIKNLNLESGKCKKCQKLIPGIWKQKD